MSDPSSSAPFPPSTESCPDPVLMVHVPNGPLRIPLGYGIHTVGREADNSIQIDHPSISGRHCALIRQSDDRILVRDLNSTNGIHLDGQRITAAPWNPNHPLILGEVPITLVGSFRKPDSKPPVDLPQVPSDLAPIGPIAPAEMGEPIHSKPGNLFGRLLGAFAYPFRSDVLFLIVFICGIQLAESILPRSVAIVGLVLGLIVAVYLFELARDIVLSSARGEDEFPGPPDISWHFADLQETIIKSLALGLVCFGPMSLARIIPGIPPWGVPLAGILGFLYFPMAFLALLVSDSLGGLSPTVVIPSIMRTPGSYLLLIVWMLPLVGLVILPELWLEKTSRFTTRIGLQWVMNLVGIYLLIAWIRMLGIFYHHHQDRLAWH